MNYESSPGDVCVRNACSACCRDTRIKLSPAEAHFLRQNGTILDAPRYIDGKPNKLRNGRAYFDLTGPCGCLLENGLCGAYNNPLKPIACDKFQPASDNCLFIRVEQGLAQLIQIE